MNDFGWALSRMREGYRVRRGVDHPGWSAAVSVGIAQPHDHLTLPYIYLTGTVGTFPWTPGQWDLLAEDWTITERTAT